MPIKSKANITTDNQNLLLSITQTTDFLSSASELSEYNNIDPNFALTIINSFTNEQKFRHEFLIIQEKNKSKIDNSFNNLTILGMLLVFIIVLTCIFCSIYLVMNDKVIPAAILSSVFIIPIVKVIFSFVKNLKS